MEYYRTDSAHRIYLKYLRVTQLVHIVLHLEWAGMVTRLMDEPIPIRRSYIVKGYCR